MKIAILSGVSRMGSGFALRLAKNHEIIVTSRILEKATQTANELEAKGKSST